MKYISIKEFQKNLYASIKELPVIVTKNDQPFLKVEPYSQELPQVATIRPAEPIRKFEMPQSFGVKK